jgi:hypothetical protein
MRVGGRRRLRVAPHLAYREAGVPGVIPPNALLTVEIEVALHGLSNKRLERAGMIALCATSRASADRSTPGR